MASRVWRNVDEQITLKKKIMKVSIGFSDSNC